MKARLPTFRRLPQVTQVIAKASGVVKVGVVCPELIEEQAQRLSVGESSNFRTASGKAIDSPGINVGIPPRTA